MLYEVITPDCLEIKTGASVENSSAYKKGYRITSYNVCYTKLLREGLTSDDPYPWSHSG